MNRTLGFSGDLSAPLVAISIAVAAAAVVLLAIELRRHEAERRLLIFFTGVLATALALLAQLRPVAISARSNLVGPKVIVLVDRSRSLLLPEGGEARDEAVKRALPQLSATAGNARLSFFSFGDGPARPVDPKAPDRPKALRSDLLASLRSALDASDELPQAIVVVSDGRLETPADGPVEAPLAEALGQRKIPVHTVSVAHTVPRDATIRRVRSVGAAVAHQPLTLSIEVACTGGLACDTLPVTVRELLDNAAPALLASGNATLDNGVATLDLPVTLDRAGPRLVEVAIGAPDDDQIKENNRRLLTFDVTRERVRLLHVAGRPTYDVRALRTWLKSNASVDVIAFFILRTTQSNVHATESELALIPFPVDELFTENLPSFDAVILQDIDARPYGLSKHIPNVAKYVESGGGLVMVGGPGAFLGGNYGGTEIDRVLPVTLKGVEGAPIDLGNVVPRPTAVGQVAPMLSPLRALFGNDLPSMPGCNVVGDAKQGALTLWEHPTRKTSGGKAMPLLSLGEFGDGRSIAIAIDGAHRLGFSEFAARVAGRGHGALWDGLLGWLMRDPRFEPAQVELPSSCIAGEESSIRVTPLPGTTGAITAEIVSLSGGKTVTATAPIPDAGGAVEVPLGRLEAGGYMARVRVSQMAATRRAFACETGGDEWADPRPDEAKLAAIAKATGGQAVRADEVGKLTFPRATEVSAERSVSPLLPAWLWAIAAAGALGGHWLVRRRSGLA